MFAFLAKIFEIAESKYLSEHRKLLPQQSHHFTLVRRDVDTSWTTNKKLGLVRRNDTNKILVEPRVWKKWLSHDDNCVRLRPAETLIC